MKCSSRAGQVVAHGPELRPARAAGQEEQHRVVGVVPPDHQPELVAVDVDGCQLGDAPGQRFSISAGDRSRGCGPGDDERDPDEQGGGCRHGRPAQDAARAPGAKVSVATGDGERTPRGTDGHRQQRYQGVEPATDHEGEHPVCAEVGRVHGRAVQRHPGDLEGHREHEGGHEHRPARPGEQPRGDPDREADDDRGQRAATVVCGDRGVSTPATTPHPAARTTATTQPRRTTGDVTTPGGGGAGRDGAC